MVRIDAMYHTSPLHHNAIDGGSVRAAWQGDGALDIAAPVQFAEMAALALAQTACATACRVRWPSHGFTSQTRQVRIRPVFAGGAFWRNNSELFLVLAAMAAKVNRRPVLFQLSRKDTFFLMPCHGETRSRMQFAGRADGTLVDMHATLDAALGAFGEFIEPLGEGVASVYACPNLLIEQRIARLHLSATGWMRGPGLASGILALASAMDEFAVELKMDPLALLRHNYATVDPQTGKPWSSKSLDQCQAAGAEAIGWDGRYEGQGITADCRLLGYGMTGTFHPNRQVTASVRFTLRAGGRADVATSVKELGQGVLTALTLLAAETLGIAREVVTIRHGAETRPAAPTSESAVR